jgi:predicted translin family RNA/ssDNA-binding protein
MTSPAAPTPLAEDSVFGLCDATKLWSDASDWAAISAELAKADTERDAIFKETRRIQALGESSLLYLHRGMTQKVEVLAADAVKGATALLASIAIGHRGLASHCVETLVKVQCYRQFLSSGTICTKQELTWLDAGDNARDDYLGGVMGFVSELSRYALGRATNGDKKSVVQCRDMVELLNGEFMKFDFRNGPLRRKYDGIKYTVKRLETMLYELSLTNIGEDEAPAAKKQRVEEGAGGDSDKASPLNGQLEELRLAMVQYDESRDLVIKRCRDVLKASKNAVYSLHRGDLKQADTLLAKAENATKELAPLVEANPTLRFGSYSNALEEYVEAQMYKVFLQKSKIASRAEMPLDINNQEYLLGLIDFTGEVGRYAVACATTRNLPEVKKCYTVVDLLLTEVHQLKVGGNIKKKSGALRSNLGKLENMVYELALASAGKLLKGNASVDMKDEGAGAGGEAE